MTFRNNNILASSRFANLLMYKLIFICFSIYIWVNFTHFLPWYAYALSFIAYCFFYYTLHDSVIKYSHIADFILIFIFLFGKQLNSFGLSVYLFLPLISRGIFIDKENDDKYYSVEYLFTVLILFLFPNFAGWGAILRVCLLTFALLTLNNQYSIRWRSDETLADLLDLIDIFYTKNAESYQILRDIISYFKEKGLYINSIACFSSDENFGKLHIINSSTLIMSFKYNLSDELKNQLKIKKFAQNGRFEIDNHHSHHNIIFPIKQYTNEGDVYYLLFVIFSDEKFDNIWWFSYKEPLKAFFTRLSKVILVEHKIRERRKEEIQNLQEKSRFVNASINTMHFIKNRLTPFQTLLDYLNNEGNIQNNDAYPRLLNNVSQTCEQEMYGLLNRAQFILDKENNPFKYQELTSIDSRDVYNLLRNIWNSTIHEGNDNLQSNVSAHCKVQLNYDGIDILFSDIIGNIQKYSILIRTCLFEVNQEGIVITFCNDYSNILDVPFIVEYLNSNDNNEAFFKLTHGIPLIKQNCKDQRIVLFASTYQKENSNIYQMKLTINKSLI